MSDQFILLPAVDIVNGQAVRLHQGEAGTEKSYGDPLAAAANFAAAGATWLHLVDLDAAFDRGSNADLIHRIVTEIDLNVEVSGGIRDDASLDRVLNAGAKRVNLGTAALENPQWTERVIATYGEAIAVGLDVRDGRVSGHGWTRDGGDLWEVLARLDAARCPRYVLTDVSRDGTLTGPNLELLRRFATTTPAPVIASGGVSTLADLTALAQLRAVGVEGAIVGKALYAGQFSLTEALAAVAS